MNFQKQVSGGERYSEENINNTSLSIIINKKRTDVSG